MRFMMIMYPGVTDEDSTPDPEAFGEMSAYNAELAQPGVLLALDGLYPSGSAVHVTANNGGRRSPTARSPKPRRSSAATGSSRPRPARRPSSGPQRVPIGEGPRVELRQIREFSELRRRSRPKGASPRCRRGRPSSRGDGDGAHGRRHLADRVGPADRRAHPDRARRRRRRGSRAGRAGRGARDVAAAGVPEPGAWLMATARNRAIDLLRRARRGERKPGRARRGDFGARSRWPRRSIEAALRRARSSDDVLGLVFMCCHPVLPTEARVALTLRLIGGLTTARDRARVPHLRADDRAAHRARQADARRRAIPFEVPRGDELAPRLASVLEVVYLIFNEGYSATAGDDWLRPALCEDALRLGCAARRAVPNASRGSRPRRADGDPGLTHRAHRAPEGSRCCCSTRTARRWDQLLIRRGLAALAAPGGGAARPYGMQAAIAACHARPAPRRHRLGDRGALRRARPAGAVAGGRAQPRGRGRVRGRAAAGLASPTRCATSPPCASTTCCRACVPTCWPSSTEPTRRARSRARAAGLTQNERERARLLKRRSRLTSAGTSWPLELQSLRGGRPRDCRRRSHHARRHRRRRRGPRRVLLHGLSSSRRYVVMGSQRAASAAGAGSSATTPAATASRRPRPRRRHTAYGLRSPADLVALLDALGLDRAVLAGGSMGSHTILRLALDVPERVAGLVVITPAYDPVAFDAGLG